jgi:hypothetical protein
VTSFGQPKPTTMAFNTSSGSGLADDLPSPLRSSTLQLLVSAVIGGTRDARRAGIHAAPNATPINTSAPITNASGSRSDRPRILPLLVQEANR